MSTPPEHEHESNPPDPLIGRTISGRYRVQSLLGQGGMGTVYQAQQIPLGRAVAVKVLSAGQVEPGFHKRFFQEAAILAKLKSPNTITVFDYGRDDDIYFIAMELVSGHPLDRILDDQGALPVARALGIAQQVCRSLREAHAQGIVHRDLKPGNIVLTQGEDNEELVKVLDFGLAKRVNRASDDTQRDTVPGSPRYMAPEVIRQQAIDGRSDMYGLGVLLYQMLTGAVPFERESAMEILVAHLQEEPPPMREMNPDVTIPEPLERIVMRCLAKAPNDRYAGMQELLDALRSLAGEIGIGSDPSWMRPTAMPGETTGAFAISGRAPRLGEADSFSASPPARFEHGSNRLFVIAGVVAVVGSMGAYLTFGTRSGDDATVEAQPPAAGAPAAPAPDALATHVPTDPAPLLEPAAARPAADTVPAAAAGTAAQPPAAGATSAAPETATTPVLAVEASPATGAPPGAPAVVAPAEIPAVQVSVTSEPDGATVLIDGKRMGVTPTTFEWRDARARVGGTVVMVVRKSGYPTETVRAPIEGAQVTASVSLDPNAGDFDLRALQDRARAIEEAGETPPVLQIRPSEQTEEPTPVAE